MVPSIAVMPREGSLALAFFGKMRKVQEARGLQVPAEVGHHGRVAAHPHVGVHVAKLNIA